MLTLTDNAATVIKRLAAQAEDAKAAGLRIGAREGDSSQFAVEISAAPEKGDEVVEENGARVFLDGAASPSLTNKELDAHVGEESVQFTLRNRT